jgi:uncharacterized membrane protein
MGTVSPDRWSAAMMALQVRNAAMLVMTAVVLVIMVWWGLLRDRPRLRRVVGWVLVVLYVFTMCLMAMATGGAA